MLAQLKMLTQLEQRKLSSLVGSWADAKEVAKRHAGLLNLQIKKTKTEHTNHIKYYAYSTGRSSPFSLNYHIKAKHMLVGDSARILANTLPSL